MQSELRALIALGDPGFFLKWEVLMAESPAAALRLAGIEGDPGERAASQSFAEIRQAARGREAHQLRTDQRVRRRLEEIHTRAPFHLSSSMLLLQGPEQRPGRVEPPVAARILRSAVEPLGALARSPLSNLTHREIAAAAGAARREVDRFAHFFGPGATGLHREAVDLIRLAESMARGKEAGRTDRKGRPVTDRGITIFSIQQQLRTALAAYLRKLAPDTGEPLPGQPLPGQPLPEAPSHRLP